LGDCAATIYHINQVSLRQAISQERLLGLWGAVMAAFGGKGRGREPIGTLSASVTSVRDFFEDENDWG
jgi:hypothetical protein